MEIIWPAPDGVDHLTVMLPGGVPGIAEGQCGTCPQIHNIGHAVTVAKCASTYLPHLQVPCVTEVTDWPYECGAKDANPDATVYRCTVHGIWWHEPAAA